MHGSVRHSAVPRASAEGRAFRLSEFGARQGRQEGCAICRHWSCLQSASQMNKRADFQPGYLCFCSSITDRRALRKLQCLSVCANAQRMTISGKSCPRFTGNSTFMCTLNCRFLRRSLSSSSSASRCASFSAASSTCVNHSMRSKMGTSLHLLMYGHANDMHCAGCSFALHSCVWKAHTGCIYEVNLSFSSKHQRSNRCRQVSAQPCHKVTCQRCTCSWAGHLSLPLLLGHCIVEGLAGGRAVLEGEAGSIRHRQGCAGGLNGHRMPHLHWLCLQAHTDTWEMSHAGAAHLDRVCGVWFLLPEQSCRAGHCKTCSPCVRGT